MGLIMRVLGEKKPGLPFQIGLFLPHILRLVVRLPKNVERGLLPAEAEIELELRFFLLLAAAGRLRGLERGALGFSEVLVNDRIQRLELVV